jgi:hypothetical protein
MWNSRDLLLTFVRVVGLDATTLRANLAIRFGVILCKGWRGNWTWADAPSRCFDP